mmetsp:Transcript_16177/g.41628  ORF Transcript_16177/g.41628 Transcript_16177/m.41628 type:complete len:276 (-) Transcript_16177:278-1105(-)
MAGAVPRCHRQPSSDSRGPRQGLRVDEAFGLQLGLEGGVLRGREVLVGQPRGANVHADHAHDGLLHVLRIQAVGTERITKVSILLLRGRGAPQVALRVELHDLAQGRRVVHRRRHDAVAAEHERGQTLVVPAEEQIVLAVRDLQASGEVSQVIVRELDAHEFGQLSGFLRELQQLMCPALEDASEDWDVVVPNRQRRRGPGDGGQEVVQGLQRGLEVDGRHADDAADARQRCGVPREFDGIQQALSADVDVHLDAYAGCHLSPLLGKLLALRDRQ